MTGSDRELIYQLAQCVNVAYASTSGTANDKSQSVIWNNPTYLIPTDDFIAATKDLIIKSAQSFGVSLQNVEPIWVCESTWSIFPSSFVARVPSNKIHAQSAINIFRSGFLLFGYYALGAFNGTEVNLCIYRGTATIDELDASITFPTSTDHNGGWDTTKSIELPTPMWTITPPKMAPDTPTAQASVKASFWSWYTGNATSQLGYKFFSVAQSASWAYQKFVSSVKQDQSRPWFLAGHSLGGPMISLTALDMSLAGLLSNTQEVRLVTFGSLVVGDQAYADLLNSMINAKDIYRINNACDGIPSLRGFWATTSQSPKYVHVGVPFTFVWQKDDDYANHSMLDTYQAMFADDEMFKKVIIGTVKYRAVLST